MVACEKQPTTIKRHKAAILGIFRYMIHEGYINSSDVFFAQSPKLHISEPNIIDYKDINATINDPNLVDGIEDIAVKNNIEVIRPSEPFRWSEDFGYYLRVCKGAFFGVGDGEDYPQLHTSEFEFPDDIAETVLKIYMGLICSI